MASGASKDTAGLRSAEVEVGMFEKNQQCGGESNEWENGRGLAGSFDYSKV